MPSLDEITNTFFPEKYALKFSFCPKSACKYRAVPPGHPIVLVKSDKLNMAAVSVKRSIELKPIMETLLRRTTDSVDRGSGGRRGGGGGGFCPQSEVS